ncbi:hypothetical protein CDD83_8162 [Cordyceps sp. RAO-2017]|nr:hypothetical protein CDD83_8162 [Cordyceps sp. RAO-2017]
MDSPRPSRSPDSDVSPLSSSAVAAAAASSSKQPEAGDDYFCSASNTSKSQDDGPDNGAATTVSSSSGTAESQAPPPSSARQKPRRASISFAADLARPADASVVRKPSSASSVVFRPQDPSLPQGQQRQTDGSRIRASSPPYHR